jgi:hypothetical protein
MPAVLPGEIARREESRSSRPRYSFAGALHAK